MPGTGALLPGQAVDTIRQISFDVVHRLKRAETSEQLFQELQSAGGDFGYDSFIVTGLPQRPSELLADCSLLVGWPLEWAQRYTERDYVRVDPVIEHIRHTIDPFVWSEVAYDRAEPGPARVMNEAPSFGLVDGYCVPVHRIDGREAGVSFGAARLDLSDDARAGLHMIAVYAFSKAASLRSDAAAAPERGASRRCSQREIECMRWAAAGKTSWETSEILTLSQRTVETYLASAAKKLHAVNRVQLIAEALRRGLID
ncbi:LuxR family transcriptional regulator [uncultured Methylobacterium sp.]|uniref:LuxR family transcriptional regulator n=1 Tax=uncultured Methylobacterium sp. TaxID=157278 RepID=UPI00260FB733|nr:LuxR family transcriptional regulator [uncultured Methylobacterium sp.]